MRLAARLAAVFALALPAPLGSQVVFDNWDSSWIPEEIRREWQGPLLISSPFNHRVGVHGSGSCLTAWTSGSGIQAPVDWGATSEWIRYDLDLAEYANDAVSINFVFETLDGYFNAHRGVFIDNIEIVGLKNPPDPEKPTELRFFNGAETEAERNWMLTHNTHGTKPGWHAVEPLEVQALEGAISDSDEDPDTSWVWWYGNDASGTYEAEGEPGRGTPDPFPGDADNPPSGSLPGLEDDSCRDARNGGHLLTPVVELGPDPRLIFEARWELEGVLPVSDRFFVQVARDRDKDGLLDIWEGVGIDANGDGEADTFLSDLHPVPPDALHKDVYVEIDCMDGGDHTDCPLDGALERASEAFGFIPAPHPLWNPDDNDGITLHPFIDRRDLPHSSPSSMDAGGDFHTIKAQNFDERWKCCVHYSLWAHAQEDFELHGRTLSAAGRADLNGPNSLMTVPEEVGVVLHPTAILDADGNPVPVPPPPEPRAFDQAAVFIHELGHNLGIHHGGIEDATNFKPHYLSVMNYRYHALRPALEVLDSGGNDDGLCDRPTDANPFGETCERQLRFSEWDLGSISEIRLHEKSLMNGGTGNPVPDADLAPELEITSTCARRHGGTESVPTSLLETLDFGYDWSCNGALHATTVLVDANKDGSLTNLHSPEDPFFMDLIFGDAVAFANSAGLEKPIEEPLAVLRRFHDPVVGDQQSPRIELVEGLVGSSGNPAVRLDVVDPPSLGRPAAEVSGIRRVAVTGPNVDPIEQFFAESPPTLETSIEIESNDGATPVFRAEVRDMAANLEVVDYPAPVGLGPPVCGLAFVHPAAGRFDVYAAAPEVVAEVSALEEQNATVEDVTGGAETGFLMHYVKSDPAQPARVRLEVFDALDVRTECTIEPDEAGDFDGDDVPDVSDVCPDAPDPGQEDSDGDGVGDACVGVVLPDLTGLDRGAATAALGAANLRLGGVAVSHHPTIPADSVLAQLPDAGALVPEGAPVDLVVSSGPELFPVPDLAGLPRATAELALVEGRLSVGAVDEAFHPSVATGLVIGQLPGAGAMLVEDAPVAFTVSRGPRFVDVPDVTGLAQAAAEAAIAAADLSVGAVTAQNDPDVPADDVISQLPAPGSSVVEGGAVDLVVSLGPVSTEVPGVVGLDFADAVAAMEAADLFVASAVHTSDESAPEGQVIAQSPLAGSSVPVESAVELTVSLGPAAVIVDVSLPDLVGLAADVVPGVLGDLGLNVGSVTNVFSDTVAEGVVVSQDPAPGSSLPEGSFVDYSVSLGPEFFAALSLAKQGPASVHAGEELRYTLDFASTGNLAAPDAILRDPLPPGLDFVAASDGGAFNALTRTVTWVLGTLDPGEAGSRTVDVRTRCGVAALSNQASLQASGAPLVQSQRADTAVLPAPATPVEVSVDTLPERDPLRPGDRVTYAIRLANPGAADQRGIQLVLNAAPGTRFESLVEDAGGSIESSADDHRWIWRGDLAAGASADVVVDARVDDCVSAAIGAIQLAAVNVQSCAGNLGSAGDLDAVPFAHPIRGRLSAPGLFPTLGVGDGQTLATTDQPAHVGDTIQVRLEVENLSEGPLVDAHASFDLPPGLPPVGDPPFVAPVDPGASFDAAAGRVSFTGDLAQGETRQVMLEVQVDPGGACRQEILASGGAAGCDGGLRADLVVLGVPPEVSEPHLLGIDEATGLWRLRPGIDAVPEQLLCSSNELVRGLGPGPLGSLYVAGLPSFHYDPALPQLDLLGAELHAGIPAPGPTDVAYDESTDPPSLVFVGERVWRYDLDTRSLETILDDPALSSASSVKLDGQGRILALFEGGIARIDPRSGPLPLAPGSYELFGGEVAFSFDTASLGDRTSDAYSAFDLEDSGSALALLSAGFFNDFGDPAALPLEIHTLASLVRHDLAGGFAVLDELVSVSRFRSPPPPGPLPAFLDPLLPLEGTLRAAAIGGDGELYVASGFPGGLAEIRSGPPVEAEVLVAESPGRATRDLAWREPAPECVAPVDLAGRPKPGKVDLTWTALPVASYDVLRAPAAGGPFAVLGRSDIGIYVDFTAAEGESYDYALDTRCRDGRVLRSGLLRVDTPVGADRRDPVPPPACGLLGPEALLPLALLWRRRRISGAAGRSP